jgi:hypothetical protein
VEHGIFGETHLAHASAADDFDSVIARLGHHLEW